MDYTYNVAGVLIRFESEKELLQSRFVPAFRAQGGNADRIVKIESGDTQPHGELAFEGKYYNVYKNGDSFECLHQDLTHGRNHLLLRETRDYTLLTLNPLCRDECYDVYHFFGYCGLSHILLGFDRLMLHCVMAEYNGEALLFCGESGIGKSTQGEIWEKYQGARIINGDRAAVYLDNGRLYASSVPMCGSSDICFNDSMPVRAIVLLGKAEENRAQKLIKNAINVSGLIGVCVDDYRLAGDLAKITDLCIDFFDRCSVIKLDCLPDNSAAEALKAVIK